jgi:hypothetical protein
MQIRRLSFRTDPLAADTNSGECPYVPADKDYCAASVMTVSISERTRDNYCSSEDFDRCPLFLAKVLRRSSCS